MYPAGTKDHSSGNDRMKQGFSPCLEIAVKSLTAQACAHSGDPSRSGHGLRGWLGGSRPVLLPETRSSPLLSRRRLLACGAEWCSELLLPFSVRKRRPPSTSDGDSGDDCRFSASGGDRLLEFLRLSCRASGGGSPRERILGLLEFVVLFFSCQVL